MENLDIILMGTGGISLVLWLIYMQIKNWNQED